MIFFFIYLPFVLGAGIRRILLQILLTRLSFLLQLQPCCSEFRSVSNRGFCLRPNSKWRAMFLKRRLFFAHALGVELVMLRKLTNHSFDSLTETVRASDNSSDWRIRFASRNFA
jgi:hypothetical protein